MSDVRRLTRREPWGGYVNTQILPADGGCNLLCLTDRQVAIIRGFLFPFVRWPTRWVTPMHGELYDTDPTTLSVLTDDIDDLDLQINGGHNVPCQTLSDALADLIEIANSAGTVPSVLAEIPDAEWLPTDAETPPEEGVPPEGFETWNAYLTWKCQASWAVWNEIDRVMTLLEGFYGLQVIATIVVPSVFAFTSISWVAVPVAGIATLVGAILAMLMVWGSAVLIMDQMRTWWTAHQDAIVCQLYQSGDAATALIAIGDNVEDAIQAIEWGALVPFAGPLGDALGAAIGVFQNNSLVNPLFKLITGVVLIQVECPCNVPPDLPIHFHFTADAEGFVWSDAHPSGWTDTSGWTDAAGGDSGDESAGRLRNVVARAAGAADWYPSWSYDFDPLGMPVAVAGSQLLYRYYVNNNAAMTMHARLIYADDAEDVVSGTPLTGWNTGYKNVTSGNVGKAIKSIMLGWYYGPSLPTKTICFDHVLIQS